MEIINDINSYEDMFFELPIDNLEQVKKIVVRYDIETDLHQFCFLTKEDQKIIISREAGWNDLYRHDIDFKKVLIKAIADLTPEVIQKINKGE